MEKKWDQRDIWIYRSMWGLARSLWHARQTFSPTVKLCVALSNVRREADLMNYSIDHSLDLLVVMKIVGVRNVHHIGAAEKIPAGWGLRNEKTRSTSSWRLTTLLLNLSDSRFLVSTSCSSCWNYCLLSSTLQWWTSFKAEHICSYYSDLILLDFLSVDNYENVNSYKSSRFLLYDECLYCLNLL